MSLFTFQVTVEILQANPTEDRGNSGEIQQQVLKNLSLITASQETYFSWFEVSSIHLLPFLRATFAQIFKF